jgi:hypothetical protein
MAGIVTAIVLGAVTLAWTLRAREAPSSDWAADMRQLSDAVHLLACSALLCGAGLSWARHRMGNALVRTTSWGMILVTLGMMVVGWMQIAPQMAGDRAAGWLAGLLVLGALFGSAQWMLYLYLFRKSKYP